ncbi:MAG: leucine-rich repeat protein [Bacteroidales bacterium]|nr:leucine-rich repeat protein [Bacteroidales bacterium]
MKKLFVTLTILVGFAMQALAYDFEVDGMYYKIQVYTETPEVYVVHCAQPGWNCYSGDVVIPETVTYDGVTYTVTMIATFAFRDCVDLTSITFPATMRYIQDRAFMGCTSLTDIHIPNTVTRIHARAFENTGWYDLQPDGRPLYLDGWCLGYKGEEPLVDLTIDKQTLRVADAAFYENETLVSVTLPNTVISIGTHAFAFCPELRYFDFGPSIQVIEGDAFYMCTHLEDFTLPETVTKIGSWAFCGCRSLYRLDLPNSITTIGDYAFESCYNLAIVTLPEGLTKIGEGLFDQAGLKSITIPNGVTNIGALAFFACDGLKTALIPETVTEIGDHAFVCPNLDTVTCLGGIPASLDYAQPFEQVPENCCLIVPCGSAETYSNSRWGEVFTNIVEDCDGIDETAETINVFPNPAQHFIRVEGITAREIQCYNGLGQLVKTVHNSNEISVEDLPVSVYLLRITDMDGKKHMERMSVSR